MTQNLARPLKAKSKKILLLLSATLFIFAIFFSQYALAEPIPPKPHTNLYVFDYADLIESQDEQEMQKIAKVLDDKTKAQVVVVTVNDLSQMEIEEYALGLFRNWGIGDKEKNNGVLILVNKESLITNQRGRIRIEVGYGLEGAINDGKAGAILDNFALPAFETAEYSRGIKDAFMAVSSEIAKEYGLDLEDGELSSLEQYSVTDDDEAILFDLIVAIIIFIIIIYFSTRKRGSRRYYRRGPFNGPFGPFGGGGFSGGGFGGGKSGGGGASR
ncbi:MAG: TPM domain-containing protein [Thermoanaerobacteraceae bacterium]|nr:TPM domain-containing protein [Thermoanaerobacteraceae bacterium]